MVYKRFGPYCLAGSGDFPGRARPVEGPFAPLILLQNRDPLTSRCLYPVDSLEQVDQESIAALLPTGDGGGSSLARFIRANGAGVLNTGFPRCWSYLDRFQAPPPEKFRVTLVGLGDVGGTVLTGLKLLGTELSEIRIYDPNQALCQRYALELNQVLSLEDKPLPQVAVCPQGELFDCDLFLFTASRGVPPLGAGGDVRMAQYEANRQMLKTYARMARNAGFSGLFCQISDPVDHLCRSVFLESNRDETGKLDFRGLAPEQIQGFGLGVMAARAAYAAGEEGLPTAPLRVYGPHGAGLVVANAPLAGYDGEISRRLTARTREMNLEVRALGFKPYIAPGLSSAAVSILRLIRGLPHYGAVPLGGAYFGCLNTMTPLGPAAVREALAPGLQQRLDTALRELQGFAHG